MAALLAVMQASLTANKEAIEAQASHFERFTTATQSKMDQQLDTINKMMSGIERLTDAMQVTRENLDKLAELQEALEHDKQQAHESIESKIDNNSSRITIIETQVKGLLKEDEHGFMSKQNAPMWVVSFLMLLMAIITFLAPHWK